MKKLILTLLLLATVTAHAEVTWLTDLDAAKVTLSVNARVGSVQACTPGDHAAVLKVLDEIIADNPADLTGELKEFRAQVAAAQAADKGKK